MYSDLFLFSLLLPKQPPLLCTTTDASAKHYRQYSILRRYQQLLEKYSKQLIIPPSLPGLNKMITSMLYTFSFFQPMKWNYLFNNGNNYLINVIIFYLIIYYSMIMIVFPVDNSYMILYDLNIVIPMLY